MVASTEPEGATAPTGAGGSIGETGGGPARWRRWPVVLLAALVVLAAAGYGILKLAPNYIARSLVHTYFQGLEIDTNGVETIDINLLRGEISFGPVTFGGHEGEAAQVGYIRAKIDVRRLLSRQALVQDAEIAGIRISIQQAADGALSINDVPLSRILAERAGAGQRDAEPAPAPAPDERRPWGLGLDQLKLRDSAIVFTSARGGKATIAVNELDLAGFATWSPEEPGHIRLDGDLNQIHIALSGTATPLADNIGIDATLELTGVEVPKVETYTGGLGFDRKDGRIDVALSTSGSKILADGRIDAHLAGKASFSSFDLAHQKFGSVKLDAGALSLDAIRLLYDPSGTIDVAGDAALSVEGMDLRLHDGTQAVLTGANVGLPGLKVWLPGSGPPSLAATAQIDVRALRLGGRHVEGTAEDIAIRLSDLTMDGRDAEKPLSAAGTVGVAKLGLLLPLKKPIRIGGEAISLELPEMQFGFGPRTRIDGPLGLDLSSFALAVLKRATPEAPEHALVDIAAGRISGRLSTLSLDDAPGLTQVKVATPSLAVERFRLGAPVAPGQNMEITSSLTLRSTDIGVSDGAKLDVSGTTDLGAPKFAISIGGASDRSVIDFTGFTFNPRTFGYRENGPNSDFAFSGRINAEGTATRLPDSAAGTATVIDLGRLRTTVEDLGMDIDNPAPQWHARHLDLDLASVSAAVPGALSMMLDLKNISLADAIAASQGKGEYGFDRLAVGRIDATLTQTKQPAANHPAAPAAAEAPKPGKSARTWPPADLPVIHIGQFGLVNGGRVVLLDQTRTPPASSTIDVEALRLEHVDTSRPSTRSELRLKARLDQGTVTADGWAVPFQSKPAFDLRANIDNLGLPALSPFLGPAIGLDFIGGTLNANADARAEAGQMTGEVRAKAFNLGFADRAEVGTDRISKSVGVPLTTIVGLLEDSDGSISLTLPFEGDLTSPDFDYSKMLWNGLFRVLRALVTAPFKLISASLDLAAAKRERSVDEAAPPAAVIAFAPGEAAVGSNAEGALLNLQQALKDRPKMKLRLCGMATPADGAALGVPTPPPGAAEAPTSPLLDLARQRMVAVREALTASGDIDRSRLPLCSRPLVVDADGGPPRVEFGL